MTPPDAGAPRPADQEPKETERARSVSMAETGEGEAIEVAAGRGRQEAASPAPQAAPDLVDAPAPPRPAAAKKFDAEVVVLPLAEVADPQGAAIEKALRRHAEDEGEPLAIGRMRVGKVFRFRIAAASRAAAEAQVASLADRLLANPNTESFVCTIVDA